MNDQNQRRNRRERDRRVAGFDLNLGPGQDPAGIQLFGHDVHGAARHPVSGLERSAANRWRANASSGAGTIGAPGTAGLGQTIGGVLEMSNVDLATEFTNMITAQRGFEASSRVLSTCDEMLQTLVNLKH